MRKSGIAIVVAGALALAACGGGSSSTPATPVKNAQHVVLASIVKTAAADTAKVSLEMSFSGIGLSGVSMNANGAIDFASHDSQLTMEFAGMLGSVMPSGIETRTVDGVAYLRMPGANGAKQWIAVDTKQFGNPANGSGNPALGIGGGSDPMKILAYLEKVSNRVVKVGTETIGGVETTHYSADIDFAKAVDRADVPPALRASLSEMAGKIGTVPVDVWIDAAGLLRREKLTMDFASFVAGQTGASGGLGNAPTVTMQLDLYDFGAPVHVEAPPADQIAPLPTGAGG